MTGQEKPEVPYREGDLVQLPWGVAEFVRDLGGEYLMRSGDVGYCVDPADAMPYEPDQFSDQSDERK